MLEFNADNTFTIVSRIREFKRPVYVVLKKRDTRRERYATGLRGPKHPFSVCLYGAYSSDIVDTLENDSERHHLVGVYDSAVTEPDIAEDIAETIAEKFGVRA